jgi:hypothetical protein
MKLSRLAGLIFLAALAISLMAAAGASASYPLFLPRGTVITFKADSGTGALETESTKPVECLTDLTTGEITGGKTVGNVVVTFHNCSSKEGEGCSVKSSNLSGTVSGLIKTEVLDGELGSVKKTEAASGVGLFLLPTSGTKFVELEGPCLLVSPSPVTGTIVGEVTPIAAGLSNDGKLLFQGSKGTQAIKEINVLGTIKKPALKALGLLASSERTLELVLYASVVEVM